MFRRTLMFLMAMALGTGCGPPPTSVQPVITLPQVSSDEAPRGHHVGAGLGAGPRPPVPVAKDPPDSVTPGGTGRVAVLVADGRQRRVEVIDLASGNRVEPAPIPFWHGPDIPRVSANGRLVTYVGQGLMDRRLVVWDLEQGHEVALSGVERDQAEEPDLSGNGRYLVFLTGSTWEPGLAWYDRFAQAGRLVPIPEELRRNMRGPSLSGTGKVVAYSAAGNLGDRNIFLMELETGRPISPPTINTADEETDPALSPDGKVLLFSSNRNGSFDLFGYDLETGTYLDLGAFNSLADESQPRFAGTDGRTISYVSTREGKPALYWQTWNGGRSL